MRIRFRREAVEDVEAARAWYDERAEGLGLLFVQALERTVQLIAEFPEAPPEITEGYRRALVMRFPYALYYRVDRDVVDVIACLHTSRSPDSWRSRD